MIEFLKYKGYKKEHIPVTIVIVVGVLFGVLLFFVSPPRDFPEGSLVKIKKGSVLDDVSVRLEEKGLIRSAGTLSNLVIFLDSEAGVIAGDYYFRKPENSFTIASRITKGDFGMEPIKVTIPEGLRRDELADLLDDKIPGFNKEVFMKLSEGKEGRLYPETYFFQPSVTEAEVIDRLELSFASHLDEIYKQIDESDRSFDDILIMASILEEEVQTEADKRIVSGILWKRLDIGMPLQVDATFVYLLGKESSELTKEDLAIDSPYNTYKNRGLPPSPISSPGLESIVAALNPTETEYFYYLSGEDGTTYYGRTLDEHNKNKRLYIN